MMPRHMAGRHDGGGGGARPCAGALEAKPGARPWDPGDHRAVVACGIAAMFKNQMLIFFLRLP